nr:hypothetical protein [Cyanobium sp. HWJ4-Hawea]
MSCRQLEKILIPPQLSVFLAQPGQFSPFLAGELTLLGRAKVTAINPGLPYPSGEATGMDTKAFCSGCTGEVFTKAKSNSLSFLLRCELAFDLGWIGHWLEVCDVDPRN